MEVLTKCVILDDEKFVLIKDKSEKLTEFYKKRRILRNDSLCGT